MGLKYRGSNILNMKTQSLYEPFEIEYLESGECPIEGHKHNFFEIVYIVEGEGVQCVNQNQLPYGPEKMFLLMPQDCHSFQVAKVSKFFFIRFNDIYLKSQNKEWLQKLEYIFQHNNHMPGCILRNKSDKILVKSLVEALIREQVNQQHYHRELAQQLVNTIITIVARNISYLLKAEAKERENNIPQLAQEMLHYVHQHIYNPEALRVEKMAAHFHVAPTYIGEYFKKLTGESLQATIILYKLRLVETRLHYSELRMNEIAYELGFTDESHLNRLFKKYRGVSPSAYRKQKWLVGEG